MATTRAAAKAAMAQRAGPRRAWALKAGSVKSLRLKELPPINRPGYGEVLVDVRTDINFHQHLHHQHQRTTSFHPIHIPARARTRALQRQTD